MSELALWEDATGVVAHIWEHLVAIPLVSLVRTILSLVLRLFVLVADELIVPLANEVAWRMWFRPEYVVLLVPVAHKLYVWWSKI